MFAAAAGLTLAPVDLWHLGLGCTSTESTFVTLFALTLSAAGFSGFVPTVKLTGGDVFGKGEGDGDFDHDLLNLLFCGSVCDLDLDLDLLWCDFLLVIFYGFSFCFFVNASSSFCGNCHLILMRRKSQIQNLKTQMNLKKHHISYVSFWHA